MLRRILSAAAAAVVARRTYDALRQGPSAERWSRTNHRGETVTLAEGPAVAAGSLAGLLLSPRTGGAKAATVLAVAGASALGALDDLAGGIVDQRIKPAFGGIDFFEDLMRRFGLRHVGLDEMIDAIEPDRLAAIDADDMPAIVLEDTAGGLADPARATRDGNYAFHRVTSVSPASRLRMVF